MDVNVFLGRAEHSMLIPIRLADAKYITSRFQVW